MTIYIIAFIVASLLYAATCVADYYTKYKHRKNYRIIEEVGKIMDGFVFITFSWWMIEQFFEGSETGFGWWILFGLIGMFFAIGIRRTVKSICMAVWPYTEDTPVTPVKIPKGLQIVAHIFTLLLCCAFAGLFLNFVLTGKAGSTTEAVVMILATGLFVYGIVMEFKFLRRILKK